MAPKPSLLRVRARVSAASIRVALDVELAAQNASRLP